MGNNKNSTINKKESLSSKRKIPVGVLVGIVVSVMGFVIIIISFVINASIHYNPYKEPETYSPTTIAETFVVPEGSLYNRAYHVFNYKEGNAVFTYSKKMFSKHEIKDIQFKMEGGYVYELNGKTFFVVYLYNLSDKDAINKSIDIEFTHYNKTTADDITYKIDSLKPLQCKSVEIEVDKKVINAYDYHIHLS